MRRSGAELQPAIRQEPHSDIQRRWRVAGYDISPTMFENCPKNVGDVVRLEVADIRELPRLEDFDLAWSLTDSPR